MQIEGLGHNGTDEIEIIASFSDTESALKARDCMALLRLKGRVSYENFYQNERASRDDPKPRRYRT